jgi:hypothetical protein
MKPDRPVAVFNAGSGGSDQFVKNFIRSGDNYEI